MGVTAVIGYLFCYGTGNKLLEQPLPRKIVIVIVICTLDWMRRLLASRQL